MVAERGGGSWFRAPRGGRFRVEAFSFSLPGIAFMLEAALGLLTVTPRRWLLEPCLRPSRFPREMRRCCWFCALLRPALQAFPDTHKSHIAPGKGTAWGSSSCG